MAGNSRVSDQTCPTLELLSVRTISTVTAPATPAAKPLRPIGTSPQPTLTILRRVSPRGERNDREQRFARTFSSYRGAFSSKRMHTH